MTELGNIRRVIDEMILCLQGGRDQGKDRTGLPACGDSRSILGGQLEAQQLELVQEECEWSRTSRAELRMNRRALCILLWKQFSDDEQRVFWARNVPIGCVTYRISIRSWQLRSDDDYKRRDPKFEGKVIVERKRPQYRTLDQAAEALAMSQRQVRARTESYQRKIEGSEYYRLLGNG